MRIQLLLALTLSSCTYTKLIREPEFTSESPIARLAAPSQEQLDRLTLVVGILEPKIRKVLNSTAPRPIVWRDTHETFDGAVGFCRQIVVLGTAADDNAVAHELAHWHSFRSGRPAMPRFVEEGLAVVVAERVLPRHRLINIPIEFDWLAALAMDHDGWESLSNEDALIYYDAAQFFVQRIGLESLLEMQERGEVSSQEFMSAADL